MSTNVMPSREAACNVMPSREAACNVMPSREAALGISLLLACLVACGHRGKPNDKATTQMPAPEALPDVGPIPPKTSLDCSNGTYFTYENFGESFMLNYCTTCHSKSLAVGARADAPLDANFDTINGVQVWRAEILDQTSGDSPKMPPSGSVSPADKAALTEWLNCGAPSDTQRNRLP